MCRKRYITCIIILILSLSVSACMDKDNQNNVLYKINNNNNKTLIVKDYNNVNIDKVNTYKIDVEFLPNQKKYKAKQTVIFINNEDKALDKIYFHIYPNAFKRKETAPFLFEELDFIYSQGFEPGYIDINKLTVEGYSSNYKILGIDDTILKIPLNDSLDIGEEVEVYMEYTVTIPPVGDRFGYGNKTFNLGNWYPIVAVYDDEGWNLDPYYKVGDPFYSDVSNYEVSITAPGDYIIANTGSIISMNQDNEYKTWDIKADLVRDFAWTASKYFIKEQKKIGSTVLNIYFLEDDKKINEFVEEVCINCFKIFNNKFGEYPYSEYSVVACDFPSGMEYPGIVFVGEKYYNRYNKNYLETIIIHETAHQWWYSVVGNDEVDEAWLDESLTVYSEVVYINENYSIEDGNNYYNTNIETNYKYVKPTITTKEVILKPLNEFNNWTDYGMLVYNKGAMFIHEIEEKYGKETLYKILNEYYNRYKFKNATSNDFIKVCEYITGEKFDTMVNKWLYGN